MANVTVDDVRTAYGSALTPEQTARAKQLLDWLSRIIDREASKQGVTVDPLDMAIVLTEAIAEALRNPGGGSVRTTVQVDDASVSTQTEAQNPVGLADRWWRMLGLIPPGGDSEAFTIRLHYKTPVTSWC